MAAFYSPAWATPPVPQPGALNYVEGQASIGNQVVTSKSVGSAVLNAGDVLSTGNGRAEILLTPGIFLRLGKNSAVRMDAPELTNTRISVLQGEAMVEADLLHKEDRVYIAERNATSELDKKGVYDFDADVPNVRVYDGKLTVTEDDKKVELGKGREAVLTGQPLKSQKFDTGPAETSDPLYAWSKLRSEYLAEATASSAQTYIVNGGYGFGPGWYGAGWYWNPWWGMYSFIPGDGFFMNPFGFGLYSPLYIYRAPVAYPGVYGRGFVGRGRIGATRGNTVARAPSLRSSGAGFHGGGLAMRGGGFHGGFGGGHR
jgi:hypothetical protein